MLELAAIAGWTHLGFTALCSSGAPINAALGGALGNMTDRLLCEAWRRADAGIRGLQPAENHTVARAIRTAQIEALKMLLAEYGTNDAAADSEQFRSRAGHFCAAELDLCNRSVSGPPLILAGSLHQSIHTAMGSPETDGPGIARARSLAEGMAEAVLDEMRSALDGGLVPVSLPPAFCALVRPNAAGESRLVALFGEQLARQIITNGPFRNILVQGQLSHITQIADKVQTLLAEVGEHVRDANGKLLTGQNTIIASTNAINGKLDRLAAVLLPSEQSSGLPGKAASQGLGFALAPKPHLPQLSYVRDTKIDPQCIARLREHSGEAKIFYFDSISNKIGELHNRDKIPQNFLRKNPYYRKLRGAEEREKRAAYYHSYNDELLRSVERVNSRNNGALTSFITKLNKALVPDELYSRSLGCFAAIAALLMIRELKKGYDWVEGITSAQPWFENFIFNPQGSCCLLDWIPNRSDTGRFVFGFRYWVEARVGHGSHHERYERVMFPLKYVLPLFLNRVKGDDEAYYTWVLPQLLLCGTYWPIEEFPSSKWQVFLLTGVNGEEWQGYHEPSPWPDIVDRIAIQEL